LLDQVLEMVARELRRQFNEREIQPLTVLVCAGHGLAWFRA
jgi:hypothetical protein